MERKLVNYKTNFVYTTLKNKETTHIDIEFNVDGESSIITILSKVSLMKEDIKIIINAMQRDISHRMPIDIKKISKIKIYHALETDLFESFSHFIFNEFESEKVFVKEPMKNHTTFKIGGAADVLFLPKNEEDILKALKLCRENKIDYYVIGLGSNLLVSDNGYPGVIIKIGENMAHFFLEDDTVIRSGAGASLKDLTNFALENSLSGLEFAEGIPGNVGGSSVMNAGAYGKEMKDVIKTVKVIDSLGEIKTISNEEMDFGYRTSKAMKEGLIITEVIFDLVKADRAEIKALMDDLSIKRHEKQPLSLPSAGSIFKRPEGYFAGKLIMDSGLAGFSVGGASVSSKHCGFIVNNGNATCKDVLNLIEYIKKTVYDKFGVNMETEVKLL